MKCKRIVFTEPNIAKLLDCEINNPATDEVQVRLAVSSISSGTERANLIGSKTVSWLEKESKEAVFPRYVGYSSAGVIEKLGANATNFKIADRVAVCWGMHNELLNISAKNVYPIDDIEF